MEKSPGSANQRRRAATAKRIMDEGLRLMGCRGLYSVRVEDITQAAGVGKGTFFTHFASKEAFVARLLDHILADLARRVRPLSSVSGEPEALLASMGSVHLRYFQLRPEAAALVMQALSLPPDLEGGQEIRVRLRQHLDLLVEILTPVLEPLDWPLNRAMELAISVLAVSSGFFWLGSALALGGDTPQSILERLGRMLARGLSKS